MNIINAQITRKGLQANASIKNMALAKKVLETELRNIEARLVFQRQGRVPLVSMIERNACAIKGRIHYLSDRMAKQGVTHA